MSSDKPTHQQPQVVNSSQVQKTEADRIVESAYQRFQIFFPDSTLGIREFCGAHVDPITKGLSYEQQIANVEALFRKDDEMNGEARTGFSSIPAPSSLPPFSSVAGPILPPLNSIAKPVVRADGDACTSVTSNDERGAAIKAVMEGISKTATPSAIRKAAREAFRLTSAPKSTPIAAPINNAERQCAVSKSINSSCSANNSAGKFSKTREPREVVDLTKVVINLGSAKETAPIDVGDSMIKCPCCTERFAMTSITRHFDVHYWAIAVMSLLKENYKIACPFCDEVLRSDDIPLSTKFYVHVVTDHCNLPDTEYDEAIYKFQRIGDNFKPMNPGSKDSCRCFICNNSYSKRFDFIHHVEESHECEVSLISECFRTQGYMACPYRGRDHAIGACSSRFESEANMRKHLKDVHGVHLASLNTKGTSQGKFNDGQSKD